MTEYKYRIIRSSRKTLALELKSEGLIVRAPYLVTDRQIESFVRQNAAWIEKQLKKQEERPTMPKLSREEIEALAHEAMSYIPPRVEHYAALLGVDYGRITIRNQHSKWGSCSSKGNLNFNCLLMLAPSEVIDSVIVHEVCHLKHMNHSDRFYADVLRLYPDYERCNKWLKNKGTEIMERNI